MSGEHLAERSAESPLYYRAAAMTSADAIDQAAANELFESLGGRDKVEDALMSLIIMAVAAVAVPVIAAIVFFTS